ncbi:MAG TPA: hypothetical protein PLW93_01985 [Candidatus Absconditabacterales bacterium]|nr:hypothetical protein [Candidatus Absconditabacterales bacterium]HNG97020.1 hypothetical protein [Candidatus Absconditabacterales bacterium]
MKLVIIGSLQSDLHICGSLTTAGHQCQTFLDTQYGSWGAMSRDDSLQRLIFLVNTIDPAGYDGIVVPPIYELAWDHIKLSLISKRTLYPVFTPYILGHILPYSKVGKIGVIGYRSHIDQLRGYRDKLKELYQPSAKQLHNKHFQLNFPLYPIATNHRQHLYELPRRWFIRKLIKTDLKKLRDYAVDTIIPLDRGYLKFKIDTMKKVTIE